MRSCAHLPPFASVLPIRTTLLAALGAVLAGARAQAQTPATVPASGAPAAAVRDTARGRPPSPRVALVMLGRDAEDRQRVAQLLGRASASGFLLRSASTLTVAAEPPTGAQFVLPELRSVHNSALPFTGNDGDLRAGRGWNLAFTAGFRARTGRLRVQVVPELVIEQNSEFQTLRAQGASRSPYSSPFHPPGSSIDLPSRFGPGGSLRVVPGQSLVSLASGPVTAGFSTENEWWGPGARSALVMSSNAPGVPRFFVRNSRPLETPLGTVAWTYMLGTLSESGWFDRVGTNDRRSISAGAVTLSPAWERDLTVGFARAVYAGVGGVAGVGGHALDVLVPTRRGDPQPDSLAAANPRGSEQLMSLFARWVLPESGFEVYGEASRQRGPRSLRDLLVNPDRDLGYTLGLQWARPTASGGVFRLHGEATQLEQSDSVRGRSPTPYYTSARIVQGYTHGGQVLGAWTGPGSSSQWAAADYLRPHGRIGVELGRVRWESETFTRVYPYDNPTAHDVTLYGGLRGGGNLGPFAVDAELLGGRRLNYLFQNFARSLGDITAVSINNTTLTLTLSAPLR